MQKLIEYLKNRRKQAYLTMNHSGKYAFVGMGGHSIANLYPVINYFRLDLKYIVTKSAKNAQTIDQHFPHSSGTNDLDAVLNDSEIKGVFICTNPNAHFQLVKKCLEAGKHVFVEKPPCMTHDELQELIKVEQASQGKCMVGFQKNYASANLTLKKHIAGTCSYNYRYVTGAYPEGDAIMDLFIHPITLVSFLFGGVQKQHIQAQQTKNTLTVFLQLTHSNGVMGTAEFSTNYSWKTANEKMILGTPKGVFELTNSDELTLEPKSGTIMGIPKEKIFGGKQTSVTLSKRNSFIPMLENNQLVSSGYFSEVEQFIHLCEGEKHMNNTTLTSLDGAYQLLTDIKKNVHV